MTEDAARVTAITDAFVSHWSHFGGYPGSSLHDEDGALWYESQIPHLPYNAVIRAHLDEANAGAVAERLVARFRERDVPFMWVVKPGDTPGDLGSRLEALGLAHVERATGMDLDLDGWQPEPMPDGVEIRSGDDPENLAHFESLIRVYWSVPDEVRDRIETLNRHWTGERSPGVRFVAYADGAPIGKTFLNLAALPVVAVYGVAVLPEARGRGVARALMSRALGHAVERGATRAVLHSSPMAHEMYLRMGFENRCDIDVYATAPLRGTHHH